MKEVFPARAETERPRNNVIDFEAARQKRQTGEKSQRQRPLTPPPSPEMREERSSANRQQRIREELAKTQEQSPDNREQQAATEQQYVDGLINDILGEYSDPAKAEARNEQIHKENEQKRLEDERLHGEARKAAERHRERFAAMTPQEREQWEKDREKLAVKPLTPQEWKQRIRTMWGNLKRAEREKAAWIAERDPRYDPMTGDLLEADEFPLSAPSEYYFDGSTRPRRFIPPDSPHLKNYKPLQVEEGEEQVPESEYHERLAKRLQKAGFREVEPTLADKASFEQARWFKSLLPEAKALYLQEAMREMTQSKAFEPAGEKVARIIELLIHFLIELISPEVAAELEEKESTQKAA